MCSRLMENTVLKFPNLSSLMVIDGSCAASRNQPDPVLVNAYTTCASKLRILRLVAHSSNFNIIFPPNALELTPLEEVNLWFCPPSDCSADAEAASTFFQAIASTLTTLSISFGDHTSDDPFRLSQSFPFQRGKCSISKTYELLALSQSVSPSSNLIQFLNQHAAVLKHLRLQHTKPSPMASKSLLLTVLPHLESLNIQNGSSYRKREEWASQEALDTARAHVQHSTSTLTSLG